MLKFPYGRRDFHEIMTEGYLYLDRTHHIHFVEEWGKELLFMRPRRFGKSLWLSTLMHYYDIAKADNFEHLFGHLAIGQNPTSRHNQYLVMRLDFSRIQSHGTIEEIERSLNFQVNVEIQNFQRANAHYLTSTANIDPDNALSSFSSLLSVIQTSGHQLYLFIDEYDNSANEVMMGTHGHNQQRYTDLVKGEGMFKTFFKNLKSFGSGEGLDRTFVTGVSPIVMNDVTSGANVFEDITWHTSVNELCGFTHAEVLNLVEACVTHCGLLESQTDEVMEQMASFYNGSRFVTRVPGKDLQTVAKIYNPTLVFYFLKRFQADCLYPEVMLDSNLESDGNKLAYIAQHPSGKELLLDVTESQTTVTLSDLHRRFGVQEMLAPDKQQDHLAILLCYLGALTVGGRTPDGNIILEIPNLVMRRLYAERILAMLVEEDVTKLTAGRRAAAALFAQGDIQQLCTFVQDELLTIYDNRDARDFNELTLKTLFISLLYYNPLYVIDSEPAIQRRYGDLILMVRPGMRHHVIYDLLLEFKHIHLNEVRINKKTLTGREVSQLSHTEVMAIDVVKEQLVAARQKLQAYSRALAQKYGVDLKLRTFAVVSVGFDKIVWEEVT